MSGVSTIKQEGDASSDSEKKATLSILAATKEQPAVGFDIAFRGASENIGGEAMTV